MYPVYKTIIKITSPHLINAVSADITSAITFNITSAARSKSQDFFLVCFSICIFWLGLSSLPRSGPATDDLKSRVDFAGGTQSLESCTHAVSIQPSNRSDIAGSRQYRLLDMHQEQGLFCNLYHSDYCVVASARNLLHLYVTPGTTSLEQTQPYILNHLWLGHNRGALSVGGREQTKQGKWLIAGRGQVVFLLEFM